MSETRNLRQSGASWYNKASQTSILVGGCGGIGSHLVFGLSRAGYSVTVYDDDRVEEHNLAGQLFNVSSIGSPKVLEIANICEYFGGNKVTPKNERYDLTSQSKNIMVSAFDNMLARKEMFKKWLDHYKYFPNDSVFVDCRLLAEVGTVFLIDNLVDAEWYFNNHIYDDSAVEDLSCSYKATTYCSQFIAGLTVAQINNWVANKYADDARTVSRSIEFYLPLLLFEMR